jgi:hypothetical protein
MVNAMACPKQELLTEQAGLRTRRHCQGWPHAGPFFPGYRRM